MGVRPAGLPGDNGSSLRSGYAAKLGLTDVGARGMAGVAGASRACVLPIGPELSTEQTLQQRAWSFAGCCHVCFGGRACEPGPRRDAPASIPWANRGGACSLDRIGY